MKNNCAITALAMMFSIGGTAIALAGTNPTLHIDISDLRSANGHAVCHLFNTPDGYPEDHSKSLREVKANINNGHAACDFADLPAGTYAVIVLHDENDNNKMDKIF